jgi:K+-sensing histidine kinase KdpD
MNPFYYAIDDKGEFVFGHFPSELAYVIKDKPASGSIIDVVIDKKKYKARFGWDETKHGTIYVLATEEKYLTSAKTFKTLMQISIQSLESLSHFKNKIVSEQNDLTDELIHNLKSQNAYSIQNLYALIPQHVLSQNYTKQQEQVRKIITAQPLVTVNTLLNLIKFNLATKIEFTVFDRTMKENWAVDKKNYSIRAAILDILTIFIADFEKRHIEVSLAASEKRFDIDFDTLSVSLYFILENATKYCCSYTPLKIFFKEENDCFAVVFDMISLKIEDDEATKIFDKAVRGRHAVSARIKGDGLGMYRILKTLKFNNAEIEVTPRITHKNKTAGSTIYENNQFKLKFMGQQSWFSGVR